jgi:hypothetical protein
LGLGRTSKTHPVTTSTPSPLESPQAAEVADGFVESRPFEWFARAGFIARGVVYGIIGILALKLALGSGGETTNQQGAMRRLAEQHFGKVLLLILAAGLAGYAVWRLTRAALGRGPEGSDKGFDRIAALGSGLVYAGLFLAAVQILRGSGGDAGGNAKKTTADAFDLPAGKWLVLLAGIVLIGIGLYQGYRGLTQSFLEDSKTEEMAPEVRDWIARIGTVGHLARFVVFGLIGVFLIKAALDYNARAAVGLDGALAKLQHQTYGHLLLGVVAVGLISFALYSVSDARYRRI